MLLMAHIERYGRVERLSYSRIAEPIQLPNLIQVQLRSYEWFLEHGLREALNEVFPIKDFTGNLELSFIDYSRGEPKYSVHECKERDVSFQAPLKLKVRLTDKENGEIKESEVYMGDLPLMTDKGTFIINGAERVVVSQLVKSPGVYFSDRLDVAGNVLYGATLIPNRGAWFELEMDSAGVIYTRIDKTRKIPVSVLLRAIGFETNDDILELYGGNETILTTLEKDPTTNKKEALIEFYRRLRPGELAPLGNQENALVVDLRPIADFDKGHIAGAKNVQMSQFDPENRQLAPAKKLPVVLVCKTGKTAGGAASRLKKAGVERIYLLDGGITGWQQADLPLSRGRR